MRANLADRLTRAIVLGAVLALPSQVHAQEPGVRALTVARSPAGVDTLHANVRFAGGRMHVAPAENEILYSADVRYDVERARPIARFDAGTGRLDIGADAGPISRGFGLRRMRRDAREVVPMTEMTLRLGPARPVILSVDASAAHGELELGAVPLHRMRLQVVASDAGVRFGAPNPAVLRELELSARAASLRVDGLARANARRIVASVTAGQMELDFGGDWAGDAALEVRATLGQVRLLLPNDVGVRITARERLWGQVQGALVERDGAYLSANWDSAPHRLEVTATATMGAISVERIPAR